MVWQQWVYLALAIVSSIAGVSLIGRERTPYTRRTYCLRLLLQTLFVWMILSI